jgi:hypothetical protein
MFLLNGKPLAIDTPFTADDIKYPANWLRLSTLEEKEAIGMTEVPDPEPYDQRFYWGPGVPKDHAQLVEQWVAQTRITAGTLLAPTDWQVIRQLDNGTEMPTDIKASRQDIRTACNGKVAAIEATTSTDELAAYITGTEYPVWVAEEVEVEG